MTDKDVKERIKALLKQRNMNMSDLVTDCNMSKAKLSKLISGNQDIKINDLITIGYVLGVNPASLLSPSVDDIENSYREIMPLNSILRSSATNRCNERLFSKLINNDLMNTMTQYIDLKGSGKCIYTHAKKKRHDKTSASGLVSMPKAIITDAEDGQLFSNQLVVGYWFPDDIRYVYLSINYIREGKSSISQLSSVTTRNMIDYFSALISIEHGNNYCSRKDLTNSPEDEKMLDVGTILYKKYRTDVTYIEDDLRKELQNIYEIYLRLLKEASRRIQTTYENMYQRGRDTEKSENKGKDNSTFDIADLDRIMSDDISSKARHSNYIRAKNKALSREEYKCELNAEHTSFIDRKTGKNYMEGHMLIPSNAQSDFKESLYVEANICSLCPVCKSMINRASAVERQEALMELYLKHKDMLKEKGIDIAPMQLFKYYGMS